MSQGFLYSYGITLPLAVAFGGTGVTTSTGSGATVLGTAPTINQANLVGVTNGSSAAAGSVGEVISSVIPSGSAVALANVTMTNIASIILSPGQWSVTGYAGFGGAGSVVNYIAASVSLTSNTITFNTATLNQSLAATGGGSGEVWTVGSNNQPFLNIDPAIINVSVNTAVYLVGYIGFTGPQAVMYGKIVAQRTR